MADDAETFEASAFESLEKDFQEVLQELVGDKSLEHFRQEYEKLHRALKGSHENEKRLIKKCRELNSEIVSNAVKVQTALKLSQEDQGTITALQKEIERAWKMVEGSHDKEQRAKDTITSLKGEITNLSRLVEQGAGLSINQENALNNLVSQKNDLIKHRDLLQSQVSQLQGQHNVYQTKVNKLEADKNNANESLEQLKEQLSQKKTIVEKEQVEKEQLEQTLKELRELMDGKVKEIDEKRQEVAVILSHCAEWAEKVKIEKQAVEKKVSEQNALEDSIKGMNKLNGDCALARHKLQEEVVAKRKTKEAKEEELRKAIKEKKQMQKDLEAKTLEKEEGEKENKALDESRKNLKAELSDLTAQVEKLKMQSDADEKTMTAMLHERDLLHKNVVRGDERGKTQAELVRQRENEVHHMQKEVHRWKCALQKVLKRVAELEKQREKAQQELGTSNNKNINAQEEIRIKDAILAEHNKQIADVRGRLGQQKNLYEAVRTDRNLYSKNLLESQEEIVEMRKKFKIMHHQIEQLKEEIKEKDQAMIKKHFDHHRMTKEVDKIKDSLDKAERRQQNLERVVDLQKQEMKTLEATISEAEQERQNQNKEFESVSGERNILNTQLIRRNEELALLYEKIKIQRSTLEKGETQYNVRVADLKLCGAKFQDLQKELEVAQSRLANMQAMKKELYQVEKDLLQERTKVKALAEELENPMNVHRWRKLEGSDPQSFALINKIRTLQTRVIHKTQECGEMEQKIAEKERLYLDLKALLARQPGPEIIETLEVYKSQNQVKKKQLAAMATELTAYSQQIQDYKDETTRLNRELQEVRSKFFKQKKREQVERDAARGDTKVIHTIPKQNRFTGGGFNLSM